jgi:multisubunit Na+/H+ antiporter MnhE subunit
MPTFEFQDWLTGLIVAVVVLLALSPVVFHGSRWVRPLFYFFAFLMIANGLGHTAATIFGRTVSSVRFPRPAPGFYSSPLLLAASVYALIQLRRTRLS